MCEDGWIEVGTRNTLHPEGEACNLGYAIHPCKSDTCTVAFFADQLQMLSDIFEHPEGGYTIDYVWLSEAGARGMANQISAIREVCWQYFEQQSTNWRISLGLLDLAKELLLTGYRSADRLIGECLPGVHLVEEATLGLRGMFLAVEQLMRHCLDSEETPSCNCQSTEEVTP